MFLVAVAVNSSTRRVRSVFSCGSNSCYVMYVCKLKGKRNPLHPIHRSMRASAHTLRILTALLALDGASSYPPAGCEGLKDDGPCAQISRLQVVCQYHLGRRETDSLEPTDAGDKTERIAVVTRLRREECHTLRERGCSSQQRSSQMSVRTARSEDLSLCVECAKPVSARGAHPPFCRISSHTNCVSGWRGGKNQRAGYRARWWREVHTAAATAEDLCCEDLTERTFACFACLGAYRPYAPSLPLVGTHSRPPSKQPDRWRTV